jgi:hypothetical protein
MEMDKETQKIMTEGEELQLMVRGNGWGIARRKLDELFSTFNLTNLVTDGKTPEQIVEEIKVTQLALSIINRWLEDVEGSAKSHEFNKQTKTKEETYIIISD